MQMAVMAVDLLTVIPPTDLDRIGSFVFKKLFRSYDVVTQKLILTNETLRSSPCTQQYFDDFGEKERLDSLIHVSIRNESLCLDKGQDVSLYGTDKAYGQ